MRQALMDSVRDALSRPWVLDLGATIKPLYGRRQAVGVHGAGEQRRVRHRGHRAALSRPLRLRGQLRRVEEPMGGAGAASRRTTCGAARSRPGRWRRPTTGGAGTCARPTSAPGAKR
jgi:hypothetical protein